MRFAVPAPGADRPPAPRKPKVPLAPIVKTVFLPGRRGMELWGAETKDRTWAFERLEGVPGTPWAVIHAETGIWVDSRVGTLTACRAYVASGQAEEDLACLLAHERGGHVWQRNRACPRCSAEDDE